MFPHRQEVIVFDLALGKTRQMPTTAARAILQIRKTKCSRKIESVQIQKQRTQTASTKTKEKPIART
jgi:hypothetical protein